MEARAPSGVPAVVERLRAIEVAHGPADGVACFARLYREVTEGVQASLATTSFASPQFLERLDVAFASLFFDALDAWEREPTSAPSAWKPLFESRGRRGIAPIQFALAGMNAHINRDLPVALVSTCGALGIEPSLGSPEHGDFERVDTLLARVEAKVKASYVRGWLAVVDRVVHRLDRIDDVLAMWDVGRARDAAWTNGQALWALRDAPALRDEFLASLDRMVGFAGRGLLVPADTWLRRLARLVGAC
jgi:hypothetical protein